VNLYSATTGASPGPAEAFEQLQPAVKNAWLVFEAVPEKIQIKIDTFVELELFAPPDCILASNSSSYKSREMLDKVKDSTKARILNTHYMMPPENRIVELMSDGYTAPEIMPFLVRRHKEAGLHPYVARKESTGFIVNRIWAAIKRECLMVLSEGVSVPEELDSIWSEMYGTPIGPCRMMDSE
jgi:3-hydroxyacyl-CoA dehydrogenase